MDETIQSTRTIQAKVGASAQKVKEMGARSDRPIAINLALLAVKRPGGAGG